MHNTLLQNAKISSLDNLDKTFLENAIASTSKSNGAFKVGAIIAGLYEVIGGCAGGMGNVDYVWHRKWNINLVIKTPKETIWKNEESKALYIREAKTWVELGKHPNITTAFYVREIEGIPRVVAEYADNGTLADWITEPKFKNLKDALDVSIQIVDGLTFAHKKGLVHRDLKPGNILLWKNGTAKITDFGLAIAVSREIEGDQISSQGRFVGTPAYASPEQWENSDAVTVQSDIYSLGMVLYEVFTGQSPFLLHENEIEKWGLYKDDDKKKLLLQIWKNKHLTEQPHPLHLYRQDVPNKVEALIISCLAKDVVERPSNLEQIRQSLIEIYRELFQEEYPRECMSEEVLLAADFNNRGASYIDLSYEDDALQYFGKALHLDAVHPEATYNQALLKWKRAEITDDDFYYLLNQLDQKFVTNQFRLGLCQLARQNIKEAEIIFQSVVEKENNDPMHLKYLGIAKIGTAKLAEAEKALIAAQSLLPTDPDIIRYLGLITEASKQPRISYEVIESPISPAGFDLISVDEQSGTGIWANSSELIEIEMLTGAEIGRFQSPEEIKFLDHLVGLGDGYVLYCDLETNQGNIWQLRSKSETTIVPLPERLLVNFSRFFWIQDILYCLSQGDGRLSFNHVLACYPNKTKPIPFIAASTTDFFYSRERKTFITGHDGTVEFWENGVYNSSSKVLKDGNIGNINQIKLLVGKQSGADFLMFSGGDGVIRFWELHYTVQKAFHNDDQYWHGEEGRLLRLDGHKNTVIHDTAINKSLTLIASCDQDQTVRIWDTATGVCLHSASLSIEWNSRLSFLNDTTLVVYKKRQKPSILYLPEFSIDVPFELSTPRSVKDTLELTGIVDKKISAATQFFANEEYSPSYQCLREAQAQTEHEHDTIILDQLSELWRYGEKIGIKAMWLQRVWEKEFPVSALKEISEIEFVAGVGGALWTFHAQNEQHVHFKGHSNHITSISISKDRRFAFSTDTHSGRVWELNTGQPLALYTSGSFDLGDITSSFEYAVTVGKDNIYIWDLEIEELEHVIAVEGKVTALNASSDGETVIAMLQSGDIIRAKLLSNKIESVEQISKEKIKHAKFSSNAEKILLFGETTSYPVIIDVNGSILHSFPKMSGAMLGEFVGSGEFLILANNQNIWVLKLNNDSTTQLLFSSDIGNDELMSLCVTSNGRYVCLGFKSGKIQLWEIDYELRFYE